MDPALKAAVLGLVSAFLGWCGKAATDYLRERKLAKRKWLELLTCSECKRESPRWYFYEMGCTRRFPRYYGPRSACGFCTKIRSLLWVQGESESDHEIRVEEQLRNRIVSSHEDQLNAMVQTTKTNFARALEEVRSVNERLVHPAANDEIQQRNLRDVSAQYGALFQSLELHRRVLEEAGRVHATLLSRGTRSRLGVIGQPETRS